LNKKRLNFLAKPITNKEKSGCVSKIRKQWTIEGLFWRMEKINEGKAVQRLGVSKEQQLVIENAPLGIRSAKSAGLRCISVSSYLDQECLKEADLTVDNHAELWKYIQGKGEGK
jgi:hypothetical protein